MNELKKRNIPAKGVDSNLDMIKHCQKNNIDAILNDANSYLKSVPDNTLIGISGFQFVEHVVPRYLFDFIQLSYQKIAKGGIIILETVNPMSLFSLMHFWYDFSHQKPIPPDVLKFYLQQGGFEDIELTFSSKVPDTLKLEGDDENTKKINEILFGPQDYSVIGRKK